MFSESSSVKDTKRRPGLASWLLPPTASRSGHDTGLTVAAKSSPRSRPSAGLVEAVPEVLWEVACSAQEIVGS